MKNPLITLTVLVAFAAAPVAVQASDKEVQNPRCTHAACQKPGKQVALFVSGRGVANRPAAPIQSVTSAQTGQGGGITFFAAAVQ